MDEKKIRELIIGKGHTAGEADVVTKILAELDGSDQVTVVVKGDMVDPKGAITTLGLYFDDKAGFVEGAAAMGQLMRVFRRKANFRQFTDADRVRRPRVDNYFDAIEGGANAIDEWGAELPTHKRPDTAWLRSTIPTTKSMRKLAVNAGRFSLDVADNLAFHERQPSDALYGYYTVSVRGVAAGEVADDFKPVEDFFFAPAKAGAQTAKETRTQLSEMSAKAAARGEEAAERRAQDRIARKLQNMADVMTDPTAEEEEDASPTKASAKKPRAK